MTNEIVFASCFIRNMNFSCLIFAKILGFFRGFALEVLLFLFFDHFIALVFALGFGLFLLLVHFDCLLTCLGFLLVDSNLLLIFILFLGLGLFQNCLGILERVIRAAFLGENALVLSIVGLI
jgi:hypothetical protein